MQQKKFSESIVDSLNSASTTCQFNCLIDLINNTDIADNFDCILEAIENSYKRLGRQNGQFHSSFVVAEDKMKQTLGRIDRQRKEA